MSIRAIVVATAIGAAVVFGVAGCTSTASYTRTDAEADVANWVHDVETSAMPQHSSVQANYYISCGADHAYFVTTWQWRTLTQLSVPNSQQPEAIEAIKSAFEASHWKSSSTGKTLTLTGPLTDDGRAEIIVEPAGQSDLSVVVTSACYS